MKNPGSQALLPLYLPWEANLADENPLLKVVIFLCLLTCELPLSGPCAAENEVRPHCCFFPCQSFMGVFLVCLQLDMGSWSNLKYQFPDQEMRLHKYPVKFSSKALGV